MPPSANWRIEQITLTCLCMEKQKPNLWTTNNGQNPGVEPVTAKTSHLHGMTPQVRQSPTVCALLLGCRRGLEHFVAAFQGCALQEQGSDPFAGSAGPQTRQSSGKTLNEHPGPCFRNMLLLAAHPYHKVIFQPICLGIRHCC